MGKKVLDTQESCDTNDLKLYRAYLVFGKRVMLYMCFAKNEDHVYELMKLSKDDEPQPIIDEIQQKEGGFLCHHISDNNLYKNLQKK